MLSWKFIHDFGLCELWHGLLERVSMSTVQGKSAPALWCGGWKKIVGLLYDLFTTKKNSTPWSGGDVADQGRSSMWHIRNFSIRPITVPFSMNHPTLPYVRVRFKHKLSVFQKVWISKIFSSKMSEVLLKFSWMFLMNFCMVQFSCMKFQMYPTWNVWNRERELWTCLNLSPLKNKLFRHPVAESNPHVRYCNRSMSSQMRIKNYWGMTRTRLQESTLTTEQLKVYRKRLYNDSIRRWLQVWDLSHSRGVQKYNWIIFITCTWPRSTWPYNRSLVTQIPIEISH
jgi:hypothetical protein